MAGALPGRGRYNSVVAAMYVNRHAFRTMNFALETVMRLVIAGAGALAAAGTAMVLGAGVALAGGPDDYAGKTYSDAAKKAGESDLTPVVMSRVGGPLTKTGGKETDDQCVVERSQVSSFFDATGTNPGGKVLFFLNCGRQVADAGRAGNSAASPEGRAELAREAQERAKKAAQLAAQQAKAQAASAEAE